MPSVDLNQTRTREVGHSAGMSSYRTIVVHLDGGKRRPQVLNVALALAEAFNAHLVGLFAPAPVRVPSPVATEGASVLREIEEDRRRTALAGEVQREFAAAARRLGAERSEWRDLPGDPLYAVQLSARYADLIVMGQPDRYSADADEPLASFPGDVVLSAGRPVLFVPYAGSFPKLATRVLIAWNASREAARAVHDALPLLERAQRVDVVAFDPERGRADHGELPGADIALYLARHGVKANAAQQRGTGIEVGAQILSRAADMEADLIVMGGYGHSRLRERVLGGATRTILESMTVPVLMSR